MRGLSILAVLLPLVGSACAPMLPAVSPELVEARSAFARARKSPLRDLARAELTQAEMALAVAEDAQRLTPNSPGAKDEAYVATRAAECARLAGYVAVHQEELAATSRKVERLYDDLNTRFREETELGRRREEALVVQEMAQRELERRFDRERGARGQLVHQETSFSLVLPTDALFVPHSTALTIPAIWRLRRLANALREGPPTRVRVIVVDDELGIGRHTYELGRRRAERLRAELLNLGVPADYVLDAAWREERGPGVELTVEMRPVIVPQARVSTGMP